MKLSICITHYDEPVSVVKDLLDSISIQQNVDFNDIEAIIVNDEGDYSQLTKIRRRNYPFKLHIFKAKHGGVSATRNKAFDRATGDFVMFCDVDDMFYTINAIRLIFKLIATQNFDVLISSFVEEVDIDGTIYYYHHDIDRSFIHGKVYRRSFLIDNNIRYDETVGRHQDSPFVRLALLTCSNDRVLEVKTPFYLWRWRSNSICRRPENKGSLNSAISFIDSVDASASELLRRGNRSAAAETIAHLVYKTYYFANSEVYNDIDNDSQRSAIEHRFKQFYDKYSYLISDVPIEEQNRLARLYKNVAYQKYGLVLERITFNNWIHHIQNLA